MGVLEDPSISDDQKRVAASLVFDPTSELYSARNMVSERAIIADSDDESAEAETLRIDLSDSIRKGNELKRQMQARLNAELVKHDPSLAAKVVDIAEFFVPFVEGANVGQVVSKLKSEGGASDYLKGIVLTGQSKEELSELIRKVPVEKRMAFTEKVISVINDSENVVLPDGNDFVTIDLLRTALDRGYYTDTDQFVDNIFGVLDVIGVGAPLAAFVQTLRTGRKIKKAEKAASELRAAERQARRENRILPEEGLTPAGEVEKQYVKTRVQPVSLSQNYKEVNPTLSRNVNDLAAQSEEAAQATYGTNRVEALANDELPDIQRTDGSVPNKTAIPDKAPKKHRPPPRPRQMDFVDNTGALYITDVEKASAATRVVNDFNNAVGVVTRKEMVTPKSDEIGGGFDINVTYGPKDMGWSNGQQGVDLVKLALRDYGVKDSELTLLKRVGNEYKPVKPAKNIGNGDYLVQVKYPYKLDNRPTDEWSDFEVKYNFLDRKPHWNGSKGGSMTRHLLDPASLFRTEVAYGANVAVDKSAALEKLLLEEVQDFSKPYSKLPKGRQEVIDQIIKKNNYEGRFPTRAEMKADGLDDKEVNILRSWKETWDLIYWLENEDLVKTLRSRGFGAIEDAITDTRLFGKGISQSQAGKTPRAYDISTGEIRTMSSQEVDDLYKQGGTIADLRQPLRVGEEAAERVIVPNMPEGPYLRGLRDSDTVLNYREGYYTVRYTDPHFIVKRVKDARGNVLYEQAIATAKTRKEADLVSERFSRVEQGDTEFFVRGDVKGERNVEDQNWELQLAGGRTAQRVRGERLEDSSSPAINPEQNNTLGPVDSLITSVRSVSTRAPMREYIEATKQRAIAQYGEYFPKGKYGQPQFPSSTSQISPPGKAYDSRVADARTVVEYITFLENGYINSMDEGIRGVLQGLADWFGVKHISSGEKIARAASELPGISNVGRNVAFTLYLALNPLRQVIIQSHQSVQLLALSPKYAFKGLPGDMAAFLDMWSHGGRSRLHGTVSDRSKEELEGMWQAFQESGLSASIDKQNLVRMSLTQIAETSRIGGRKNPIASGIAASRKAGFDLGENINMMTSWLTFYDKQKALSKTGKLSQRELDLVAAKARNFTLNMNRAGDMPYNENIFGMVFQFMQVPHKAVLQVLTNRGLPAREKAQVAAFNTVMYGAPPASAMYTIMQGTLPDDGELRELVVRGLEGYTLNKGISLAGGIDVGIDFSSLAASDMASIYELLTSLMTGDIGEIAANTPAGGLLFGGNARLTEMAKTVAQYTRFVEPEETISPPDLSELFKEVAGLASGMSNFYKARSLMKYQKRYNSYGGIVDAQVNTPEAVARLFGFGTLDEAKKYYVTGKLYEKKKAFEDDVKEAYKNVKQALTKDGFTPGEYEWQRKVNNWMLAAFKDSPKAMSIIQRQIKYDVEENSDMSLFDRIIRTAPYLDKATTRDIINNLPEGQGDKDALRRTTDYIDGYEDE